MQASEAAAEGVGVGVGDAADATVGEEAGLNMEDAAQSSADEAAITTITKDPYSVTLPLT